VGLILLCNVGINLHILVLHMWDLINLISSYLIEFKLTKYYIVQTTDTCTTPHTNLTELLVATWTVFYIWYKIRFIQRTVSFASLVKLCFLSKHCQLFWCMNRFYFSRFLLFKSSLSYLELVL